MDISACGARDYVNPLFIGLRTLHAGSHDENAVDNEVAGVQCRRVDVNSKMHASDIAAPVCMCQTNVTCAAATLSLCSLCDATIRSTATTRPHRHTNNKQIERTHYLVQVLLALRRTRPRRTLWRRCALLARHASMRRQPCAGRPICAHAHCALRPWPRWARHALRFLLFALSKNLRGGVPELCDRNRKLGGTKRVRGCGGGQAGDRLGLGTGWEAS